MLKGRACRPKTPAFPDRPGRYATAGTASQHGVILRNARRSSSPNVAARAIRKSLLWVCWLPRTTHSGAAAHRGPAAVFRCRFVARGCARRQSRAWPAASRPSLLPESAFDPACTECGAYVSSAAWAASDCGLPQGCEKYASAW